MIPVSQEFKKAIKSRERQIKGYVELINNAVEVEMNATTTYSQVYANISNIVDGEPVKLNYGTLDNLPLDGTQLVMGNGQNEKSPFIVSPTAGANNEISINLARTQVDAVTLIFQKIKFFWSEPKYKLFTARIMLEDNGSEVYSDNIDFTNNDINIKLNNPEYITDIIITLTPSYDSEFWNNTYFIKLNQVVLGDTKIIQDNDLVQFTVDEEVSKLVEETPVNETKITIPRPKSDSYLSNTFLQNMNEKAKIIPYIGVVTENGPEYVKMGEFYFSELKANKDKTINITGSNIIKQLQEESLKDDNETTILSPSSIDKTTFERWLENYPYIFKKIDWEHNINTWSIKDLSFINVLSEVAFTNWSIFYADRNGDLNIRHINTTSVETLKREDIFDDVLLDKLSKINTIELVRTFETQSAVEEETEVYRSDFVLTKPIEVFAVLSNSNLLNNAGFRIESSGDYADIIFLNVGYYVAFVEVAGTVGDTITIIVSTFKRSERANQIYTMTNKKANEKEIKLTFDSFTNYLPKPYMQNSPILNMTPSYETKFNYNGDPSLEAGDYINVELEDETITSIFIEKSHFKYDGGLEGSIEGVE